jgi:hypothetical protein
MAGDISTLIGSLKGIVSSGGSLGQVAKLVKDYSGGIDPGDFVVGKHIALAAPIAEDLWYLWNHVNGMTWIDKDDTTQEYYDERLKFLAEKLGGIEALRGVTKSSDITRGIIPWDSGYGFSYGAWQNNAEPWFQLMIFEILFHGQGFIRNDEDNTPEDAVGYISFPVGQLGVMEVISLIRESLTDATDFVIKDDESPVKDTPQLFPSYSRWEMNKCYGVHLIESGYKEVVPNFIHYSKSTVPESDYGRDIAPKKWARLWITRKEKWPVPGEFVGIICKASPVPHCWWFQKSNPFLYAGNWFDTLDLTSGIIVSKTEAGEETHPTTGEACTGYRIKVHGREVDIFSSDYLEYEVGTRVGVCKIRGDYDEEEMVFNHKYQSLQGDPTKGPIISTDYIIIPITFYEEE